MTVSIALCITGPINRNNRSDVVTCVMQARTDCSECPTLTSQQQLRMRRCRICIAQCSLNKGETLYKIENAHRV